MNAQVAKLSPMEWELNGLLEFIGWRGHSTCLSPSVAEFCLSVLNYYSKKKETSILVEPLHFCLFLLVLVK